MKDLEIKTVKGMMLILILLFLSTAVFIKIISLIIELFSFPAS